MQRIFTTTSYRYPSEFLILTASLFVLFVILILSAPATVCLSVILFPVMIFLGYMRTRAMHLQAQQVAQPVTLQSTPELAEIARQNALRLGVEPVDIFITPDPELNAYAFGLAQPRSIMLNEGLFHVMDRDEIQFILGHEMGHVRLGHTWLNSLVTGIAGVPTSYESALIFSAALRYWNRICEYSADRAGMLACARPDKAISALVKLAGGTYYRSPAALQAVLARIESEKPDILEDMQDVLATHPRIVRRIQALQKFAATPQYARLQAGMNQNLLLAPHS